MKELNTQKAVKCKMHLLHHLRKAGCLNTVWLYEIISSQVISVCKIWHNIRYWYIRRMFSFGSASWNAYLQAASRCKKSCIFEMNWQFFCEFGTFIRNIYDLQYSIVFLIKGDARLGFGLLKCDIFRSTS